VPLTLVPQAGRPEPRLGVVKAGDHCFDEYRECVDRISQRGFAMFPL
jgi:hypothetical protein